MDQFELLVNLKPLFVIDLRGESEQDKPRRSGWERARPEDGSGRGAIEGRKQHQQVRIKNYIDIDGLL